MVHNEKVNSNNQSISIENGKFIQQLFLCCTCMYVCISILFLVLEKTTTTREISSPTYDTSPVGFLHISCNLNFLMPFYKIFNYVIFIDEQRVWGRNENTKLLRILMTILPRGWICCFINYKNVHLTWHLNLHHHPWYVHAIWGNEKLRRLSRVTILRGINC